MPLQPSVEEVFEYAELQARVLYHEYLGSEHVLWAILDLRGDVHQNGDRGGG